MTYKDIAKKDLRRANKNFEIEEYEVALLMYQQCLEKLFKYIIEKNNLIADSKDAGLLKSHNLFSLYRKAKSILNYNVSINTLRSLTDGYFNTRYPGEDYYDCDDEDMKDMIVTICTEAKELCVKTLEILEGASDETSEFK